MNAPLPHKIARIAKASLHKLPGKSSLNVCPFVLVFLSVLMTMMNTQISNPWADHSLSGFLTFRRCLKDKILKINQLGVNMEYNITLPDFVLSSFFQLIWQAGKIKVTLPVLSKEKIQTIWLTIHKSFCIPNHFRWTGGLVVIFFCFFGTPCIVWRKNEKNVINISWNAIPSGMISVPWHKFQ